MNCNRVCVFGVSALLTIYALPAFAGGPGEGAGPLEITTTPTAAPGTDFISIYTGGEFVKDSSFGYGGAIVALNGDLARPGFLIQGFGGFGPYEYRNSAVPGGTVDGELTEASGLLGYQFFAGNVRFRAFGGVDWQNNHLSPPDPTNPVSGSETNFVATGNLTTVGPRLLYFDLFGSYTITNRTYWARGRLGYKFGASRRIIIGPEGWFYGNENFNSQRAGAFITVPIGPRLSLTGSGGFNFVANKAFFNEIGGVFSSGEFGGLGGITNGGYGTVSISTWF